MLKKMSKSKKLIALLFSVLLVFAISATYMWSMHKIDVENILQSRTVEVEIDEQFPKKDIDTQSPVTKRVSFENKGTASVFLRFTYAQYWEMQDELLENCEDSATLNWQTNLNTDWYDGGDGWYYYKKVVPANSSVDILNSVSFSDTVPEEANYNLFFQVETAQASDENSVNEDATIELFGIKGTLSDQIVVDGAVTSATVTWGDANG